MAYAPVHDYFDIHPTFSFPVEHGQYPVEQQHVVSPESRSFSSRRKQQQQQQQQHADADVTELQEVSPYWATPGHPMPTAPSHQRGWSDSTISTEEEPPPPTAKGESVSASASTSMFPPPFAKRAAAYLQRLPDGPWTLEAVATLVSWAAVGAVLGVLARYNGAALPEWPYYVTLNAVIALLATVATATLGVALQAGLSQLKWVRFTEARAPLADAEAFDEASRGTWGALKLLATARGG